MVRAGAGPAVRPLRVSFVCGDVPCLDRRTQVKNACLPSVYHAIREAFGDQGFRKLSEFVCFCDQIVDVGKIRNSKQYPFSQNRQCLKNFSMF